MIPDAAAALLLALAGTVCGVGTLLAMRRFSDQRAVRSAKARVRAHLYEMRLFGDDPVLALRAQKKLLLWNLRYARLALLPAAIVAVPAILIMSQLEAVYGSEPLMPGETALVTVQLKRGTQPVAADLTAPSGFTVETPPVRIADLRQVCWRIRARGSADGELHFQTAGESLHRAIHAGPGLRYVTPECSSAPLASIWYGCAFESNSVESIAVDYRARKISLFGFDAHWLVWFALFWLAAMLLLRRRFGVTF